MAFFSPAEVKLLREAGHPRGWVRGEVLMREGEAADFVVLLTAGLVKATVDSANGYTSLLALRGPGEPRRARLRRRRPAGATVTAMRRSEGVVVAADTFLRLLERDSALSLAVLRSVSWAGYGTPTGCAPNTAPAPPGPGSRGCW
ncbi:Crp/Fnr family transcriptional regulator [Streptomyces sp. NPDC005917]|uniref:Crp/Fnr family transcriptional regulator n=1 Tax=unclassified Streptomyces TaxID=2593676 RepID=UPI0034003E2F